MRFDTIDFSWKSFFDAEIQKDYFLKLISDVENEYNGNYWSRSLSWRW